jgi:hypothetical protein
MFCKTLMNSYLPSLGSCLTVLFGLASGAADADDVPAPLPTAVPATAPAVSANSAKEGVTFTDDSLGIVLEEMGYEVERNEFQDGTAYYYIKFSEDQASGVIRVNLSSNRMFVWFCVYLESFPKDQEFPQEVMTGLLTEYFTLKKDGEGTRRLYLNSYLSNSRLSRSLVRSQIKDLGAKVSNTRSLWDKDKWSAATEVAKQDVLARIIHGAKISSLSRSCL